MGGKILILSDFGPNLAIFLHFFKTRISTFFELRSSSGFKNLFSYSIEWLKKFLFDTFSIFAFFAILGGLKGRFLAKNSLFCPCAGP